MMPFLADAGIPGKVGLGDASTTARGLVQLTSEISASENLAATPKSVSNVLLTLVALLPKRAFAQNDFIRIPDSPGGLIIQWGLATGLATGTGFSRITYPIPYPNDHLVTLATRNHTSAAVGAQANPTVNGISKTGFDLNIADAVSISAFWISIGG